MVTVLLAGCGDDSDSSTDTTAAPQDSTPATLDVTTVDYAFEHAPTTIAAGAVELKLTNDGKVPHEVALIEIGDTPLDAFIPTFAPVLEGGPFPDEAQNVAAPLEVEPGDVGSATFTVAPGTYAMLCTLTGDADAPPPAEGEDPAEGAAHMTKGMAQVITVTDEGNALELPAADGTMTAKDYSFDPQVKAGDTKINFVNNGPDEVHFASISEFPEGTDAAAGEAAFKTALESDGPPPAGALSPEDVAFSGVFSSGLGSQFTVPGGFKSGRTYVVACFISDRAGGPPHAIANQMYKVFTVE